MKFQALNSVIILGFDTQLLMLMFIQKDGSSHSLLPEEGPASPRQKQRMSHTDSLGPSNAENRAKNCARSGI